MRLLLDTHVAIWAVSDRARLRADVREMIATAPTVYVSMASIWEIAIKYRGSRSDAPPFGPADARTEFAAAEFLILPIEVEHLIAVTTLPRLHGDPFDRLIVAQAQAASLQLISGDREVLRYSSIFLGC